MPPTAGVCRGVGGAGWASEAAGSVWPPIPLSEAGCPPLRGLPHGSSTRTAAWARQRCDIPAAAPAQPWPRPPWSPLAPCARLRQPGIQCTFHTTFPLPRGRAQRRECHGVPLGVASRLVARGSRWGPAPRSAGGLRAPAVQASTGARPATPSLLASVRGCRLAGWAGCLPLGCRRGLGAVGDLGLTWWWPCLLLPPASSVCSSTSGGCASPVGLSVPRAAWGWESLPRLCKEEVIVAGVPAGLVLLAVGSNGWPPPPAGSPRRPAPWPSSSLLSPPLSALGAPPPVLAVVLAAAPGKVLGTRARAPCRYHRLEPGDSSEEQLARRSQHSALRRLLCKAA